MNREFPVLIEGYGRMTGVGKETVKNDGDILVQNVWVDGEFPAAGQVINGLSGRSETRITRWRVSRPAMPTRWVVPIGVVEGEKSTHVYSAIRIPEGKPVKGLSGQEWVVELQNARSIEEQSALEFPGSQDESADTPSGNIIPFPVTEFISAQTG